MTDFEPGDIVLVPFPFTDQTSVKKRPAVVVSSSEYHRQRPDVIIMPITSDRAGLRRWGDTSVEAWSTAGLLRASVIKPVLATIEARILPRKLGRLSESDLASALSCARDLIAS